jgi:hypothetical protein
VDICPGSPNKLSATEEYDGSTWTSWWKFRNSKNNLSGAGTQTAGLGFWR